MNRQRRILNLVIVAGLAASTTLTAGCDLFDELAGNVVNAVVGGIVQQVQNQVQDQLANQQNQIGDLLQQGQNALNDQQVQNALGSLQNPQ